MHGGPTVRDAAIEVLRRHELTTLFANPGSTEVPFLVGLPEDLDFVLALHEASVIGLATGWALARGRPAIALLHTTAGLGNAVGALATARVNRAPLVVLVASKTAATSRWSRSWPGGSKGSRAATPSRSSSRSARRTCRRPSPARGTRPATHAARRS